MATERDPLDRAEHAAGRNGTEPDEPSARGWEAIAEWTGGVSPDGVDVLRGVRELEFVYPLIHALVGRSLREFFVRAAALEALVAAGRASFSVTDLSEALYWLGDDSREATVRALRQAGWLEYDGSQGTTITDAGRWACDVLSFLHRRLHESELLPTIAGVTYALDIGVDPLRHLQSMRSRLVALHGEIEAARASHSEVVLRQAARRIDDALALSAQLRAVLSGCRWTIAAPAASSARSMTCSRACWVAARSCIARSPRSDGSTCTSLTTSRRPPLRLSWSGRTMAGGWPKSSNYPASSPMAKRNRPRYRGYKPSP